MKITSLHILFLILLYPLFYAIPFIAFNIGYVFSVIYFFPITLFILFLNKRKVNSIFLKKDIITLLLLFALLGIVIFNTNSLRYTKPLLFILFFMVFYFLSITLEFIADKKLITGFVTIFTLLSFIFLLSDNRYITGRYTGFLSSPTVYSVYLEVFLILSLYFIKRTSVKAVLFLVAGFFVLLTKTRLNIFFYFSIPLIIYYLERWNPDKFKIILVFIVTLNLVYPIYERLSKTETAGKLLVSRYEGQRDASFGLRLYMNNALLEDYKANSNLFQKVFGRGTETSRKIMEEKLGKDWPPHNDFLRFTVDFGLLATILYLVILFRIARNNNLSFVLLLLYLFSFYHNMIYDFLLVALIIYFSAFNKEKDQNIVLLLNRNK